MYNRTTAQIKEANFTNIANAFCECRIERNEFDISNSYSSRDGLHYEPNGKLVLCFNAKSPGAFSPGDRCIVRLCRHFAIVTSSVVQLHQQLYLSPSNDIAKAKNIRDTIRPKSFYRHPVHGFAMNPIMPQKAAEHFAQCPLFSITALYHRV